MEEKFKYENRKNLYQFLIDDYGFVLSQEKDYGTMGWYVDLTGTFFQLRYYYDRAFFSIDICSLNDIENLYDLSFVQDLIYNPNAINADEAIKDNETRMEALNDFLRKDFTTICGLFSVATYPGTMKRLDDGLKKR